ncbi:hypothetical protein D3C80_1744830 [compost metagenome]
MLASDKANEGVSKKLEPIMISITPVPRPMTAVRIGIIPVRNDPKAKVRITRAIRTPIPSVAPPISIDT